MAQPETHQLLQRDRLGADLLASQPQCRNLFGELVADLELAGGGWPRPPIALPSRWPDRGGLHRLRGG